MTLAVLGAAPTLLARAAAARARPLALPVERPPLVTLVGCRNLPHPATSRMQSEWHSVHVLAARLLGWPQP